MRGGGAPRGIFHILQYIVFGAEFQGKLYKAGANQGILRMLQLHYNQSKLLFVFPSVIMQTEQTRKTPRLPGIDTAKASRGMYTV